MEDKLLIATNVINALQKCGKCNTKIATKFEVFDYYDEVTNDHFAQELIFRCDNCGRDIKELPYAKELREWEKLNDK